MVLGFSLGYLLWLMQTGNVPLSDHYSAYKLLHARIQIIGFAGSFLLGFALQAGPHIVGGSPPPLSHVIPFIPSLWLGLLLGEIHFSFISIIGNLLISVAFVGPSLLLFKITLTGDPQWRFSRGIPMATAFLLLSTSPWLALDNSENVLFILWCGPITIAMVAGQQLIKNVLKGDKLVGKKAFIFLAFLALAWLATAMATFTPVFPRTVSGLAWLAVLVTLVWGTHFISTVAKFGFAAISVTLSLGLAGMMVAATMMLVMNQELPVDAVVHLLGAGVITVLILGVVSRIVGFSSGKWLFSDLAVSVAVLVWAGVASLRVMTGIGETTGKLLVPLGVITGGMLLTGWGIRVAWRIYEISNRPYPVGPHTRPITTA